MKIIEKSWYKRRRPEKELKAVDVVLENYIQEHNHLCDMHVTYEDGSKATYIARVIYNDMRDEWIADGMHVAVRL